MKSERWAGILTDWETSGIKAAAYCRKHGIPAWQFNYWRKRLLSARESKEGGFVAFPFAGERRGGSGLWLELPSGLRLVIESGFDVDELLRVMRAVGGGGC